MDISAACYFFFTMYTLNLIYVCSRWTSIWTEQDERNVRLKTLANAVINKTLDMVKTTVMINEILRKYRNFHMNNYLLEPCQSTI